MKNIRFLLPAIFAAVLMAIVPMSANAQRFDVQIGGPGYYGYNRYRDYDRDYGYWRPYRNYVDYNPWYWRRHHHRPWYTQYWY